ncbi:TIGR02206 family membrane protein [bacterium]|nr:TIGR02206 family membrane protein [bacterium]
MPQPFHPFTHEHFLALAVGGLVVAAFILAGKRGGKSRQRASTLLAVLNLSVYPLSLAAWWSLDAEKSIDNLLPFHLCDIAAITAGIALLTRRPLFCMLTYFWGLAATMQGLVTPAISVGFPAPPFLMFFVQHFVVVAAALYLPIVDGWRPKPPIWRGPLEVYGWSMVYLVFAMAVNRLLGSNFGFASRPPDNPSLIDQLGPWPWYLLGMQVVGLVLFSLLALPFARSRTGKRG